MGKNKKNRKTIGWVMLAIAIGLILAAWIVSFCLKRPHVYAKLLQHSVNNVEMDVQKLIDNDANYPQYDKAEVCLYVFHNDSLVYWNNNLVGPKLIRRKVHTDNDTICRSDG